MFSRAMIALAGLFFSSQVLAFTCYFTLVKDSCWTHYNVTVDVMDADKNKTLTSVEVPAGKSWTRQKFSCEPAQRLMYRAQFTPVFWQSQEGQVYMATRYWTLPASAGEKDVAWDVPVCYPKDFSGVPFPPDVPGNCKCDFDGIPPIEGNS